MVIFSKKYNLEKDKLIKCFDSKNNQYYYSLDHISYLEPVKYKDLDIKTKKKLLYENKNLLLNKELFLKEQEKARIKEEKNQKAKERFNYLKSIGYTCDSFLCFKQKKGYVSAKLQKELDELVNEENVLIGIHRVGQFFNENIKQDIFDNGLIMTGHLNSGAVGQVNLGLNISYYPDNSQIINQLIYANAYKNSTGSILVRIPDSVLENPTDLYIYNGSQARLNPKYIVGYVPIYEDAMIEKIDYNPNFVKEKETYLK